MLPPATRSAPPLPPSTSLPSLTSIQSMGLTWNRLNNPDSNLQLYSAYGVKVVPEASTIAAMYSPSPAHHIALKSFRGTVPCEISFEVGDEIEVHSRSSSDWWVGRCRNRIGLFPACFVKAISSSQRASSSQRSFTFSSSCLLAHENNCACPCKRFMDSLSGYNLKASVQVCSVGATRGVFALRSFLPGELIEASPYIVDKQFRASGPTEKYVWNAGKFSLLLFGCGTLFNRALTKEGANVSWCFAGGKLNTGRTAADEESGSAAAQFVLFYALRRIVRGEEFLVYYGINRKDSTSTDSTCSSYGEYESEDENDVVQKVEGEFM